MQRKNTLAPNLPLAYQIITSEQVPDMDFLSYF